MFKRLMLAGVVLLGAAGANAAAPSEVSANEVKWAYVCCGSTCPLEDACTGNGEFTCCKEEEPEG